MGNVKHTTVAILAVAMISSLAVKQTYDFKKSNRLAAILNGSSANEITLTQEDISVSPEDAAELLNETYTQDELQNIIDKKSAVTESYVKLTYGALGVYDTPSEEGNVIDSLTKCENVEILESTEDWYKISYADGKDGYVAKQYVTESKAEAEYAAMYFDNYQCAVIKTNGGNVNLRSASNKNSSVIGQLENGSTVVIEYGENGFYKVLYGSDYDGGFVVADAVSIADNWVSKNDVSAVQAQAAQRRAAEKAAKEKAEREKAAREKAQKEAAEKAAQAQKEAKKASRKSTKVSSNDGGTYTAPSSSSKGQTIVNNAKKYLGVRYVYGGTTPSGFDCSGLVQYVCKSAGISVNRTAAAQFGNGKAVNKSDLQPGDLLFFSRGGRVSHVGIYVGNGQMIHAPQTGDVVKISSINTAYRKNGYVGARRVY